MIQTIIACLFALAAVATALVGRGEKKRLAGLEAALEENRYVDGYKLSSAKTASRACEAAWKALVVLAAIALASSCVYAQDTGEVVVIRNLGGSLAGHSEVAGFHVKAPWQDTISYDTRNNLVNFFGSDTGYSFDGGSATGPDVSVNDKSGASADIDIQANYSLDPSAAEYLYSEYGAQVTFTQNYISNDVRSVAREVSGQFDTITMLTDRGRYTEAVQEALTKKWSDIGLTVEQVSVQDVRYPQNITDQYAAAQAAEVKRQQAQNEQETAKVEAETKKIQAQGEADANAILAQSLSDQVLRQHYIDALNNAGSNGGLIVVPEGSSPLVSAGK